MDTVKLNPDMPAENQCPRCGTPLPSGALAGLCPACLLKLGAQADTVLDARHLTFVPPTVAELAPLFPQLEILELIGKGGMGAVYKARQKQLDRIVALKILPPGIGKDPTFAERFAREARALAKLNHPGIVTLFEFGHVTTPSLPASLSHPIGEGGQRPGEGCLYFFLMEFVDGVNLRQLLHAGRVSAREALAIVPQICDALQFAHDQGIVHRDIKPENILLDRRGRVKVADFGLAKIVGNNAPLTPSLSPSDGERVAKPGEGLPGLTDAGKVMGTPQYMAPEQRENPAEVDHRADIYALGVVFYQMLTGELPGKKIEPPSRKVSIDVRLDEVVLRALEKQPGLRYQQASVLKTRVETIAAEKDTIRGAAPTSSAFVLLAKAGFVCAYGLLILLLVQSYSQLPDPVACHFGADGQADGWLSRQGYFILVAGLPLFLGGLFWLIARQGVHFPRAINIPRRDYWLAPERRARTSDLLLCWLLWLGTLLTGLIGGTHELTVQANQVQPPQLATGGLLALLVSFSLALLIWVAGLLMRLAETGDRKPRSAEMLQPHHVSAARPIRLVAALFLLAGLWSLLDMLCDNGFRNVSIAPAALGLAIGVGLLNRREFCRRVAVLVTAATFIGWLIGIGWLFGKAFGLFNRFDVVVKILGHPMDNRIGAALAFLFMFGSILLTAWIFLVLMRDEVRAEFSQPGQRPRSWLEWSLLFVVLLVMAGVIRLPIPNPLQTGFYFMNPARIDEKIAPIESPSAGQATPDKLPTKTILLARATNQLVGATTDTRTVSVWTDSTVFPGEILQTFVRKPDGTVGNGGKFLAIRVQGGKASTSVSCNWFFMEAEGFGTVEAEQATTQIRKHFIQRPLTLQARTPLELFCVTNSHGGTLAGLIQYDQPTPATPDATGKVKVVVAIQQVLGVGPRIGYSARVPPGYRLQAMSPDGEADTRTPAGPQDFSSSWHWPFRPGQSPASSDAFIWHVPHQPQTSGNAAMLPQRALRGGNIAVPLRFPGQPKFESFEVVLGEPKLLFTITNGPADVRRGFLELVGPEPATPVLNRDQIIVEDLALQMIVAIRERDDTQLRALASGRIKGWPEALPQFAVELREHYRQSTGDEGFDLRANGSLVDGDFAAVRCSGPAALQGKCLVLFFNKTAGGWHNCSLRAATNDVPLDQLLTTLKRQMER